ncbi:MAG: hypothetical protein GC166_07940 [Alphaproteobacteria bacterium]|nr:hypothetical protein [Alphaproteobacteria bacterium]
MADESASKKGVPAIPLQAFVQAFLGHFRLIAVFFFAFLVLGYGYYMTREKTYTIQFRIVPIYSDQSVLKARFGGLASLAGLSLPQDNNALAFELYLQTLDSETTAQALADRPGFLQRMFANNWDAQSHQWVEHPGFMTIVTRSIRSIFGMENPAWRPPGARAVQGRLRMVSVSRTPYSPVVTITTQSADPRFGVYFLQSLHEAVDESLRDKKLTRTTRYITYLKKELAATTVSDYREALIDALSEQEKNRMMASSGLAYAAEPVEPPVASPVPTQPSMMRIVGASSVFGAFIGFVIALYMHLTGLPFRAALSDLRGRLWHRRGNVRVHPAPQAGE